MNSCEKIRCARCGRLLGEYRGEEAIPETLVIQFFCSGCNNILEQGGS